MATIRSDQIDSPFDHDHEIKNLLNTAATHLAEAQHHLVQQLLELTHQPMSATGANDSSPCHTPRSSLTHAMTSVQQIRPGLLNFEVFDSGDKMAGLGLAWLQLTDYHNDLAQAIDALIQTYDCAPALKQLKKACELMNRGIEWIEEEVGHLFGPDPSMIGKRSNTAQGKVDLMLRHFKNFSQLDVNPCLHQLGTELNSKTRALVDVVKTNFADLEKALNTLMDDSLFDEHTEEDTWEIAAQLTQLENLISSLHVTAKGSEQLGHHITKIDEKLRLASQCYTTLIA
jgi:hypothetical protein